MKRSLLLFVTLIAAGKNLSAGPLAVNTENDSLSVGTVSKPSKKLWNSSHWGYTLLVAPGKVIGLDKYARDELNDNNTFSVAGELQHTCQPSDGNPYDADYNYPTISLGFRFSYNHGTTLTRVNDKETELGNVATLYGKFSRPIVRAKRFEFAYFLGAGVGYASRKYDSTDNVNNEFIGSLWNIYFTGGLSAKYWVSRDWAVSAGVDFSHHSNGALSRPNKGTNYIGPFVGLTYAPTPEKASAQESDTTTYSRKKFKQSLFLDFTANAGAKTLLEDWFYTQQNPKAPNYRTSKFTTYGAFSFQTALMWRYARRWASGIGVDVFYGDYADKIARLDDKKGHTDEKHSPWSVGLALKHNAYYKRVSMRAGVGVYLYRHMGVVAKDEEGPEWLYEHVGVYYSIPKLHNLSFGINVYAHAFKADFTSIGISYPIKLK